MPHRIVVIGDEPDRLWSPSAEGTVAEQLARLPGASLTEDWLRRAFAGGFAKVGICALRLDGFGTIVDLATLSAADGFIIQGDAAFDRAGSGVSSATTALGSTARVSLGRASSTSFSSKERFSSSV